MYNTAYFAKAVPITSMIALLGMLLATVGTEWMNGHSISEMLSHCICCVRSDIFKDKDQWFHSSPCKYSVVYSIGWVIAAISICCTEWMKYTLLDTFYSQKGAWWARRRLLIPITASIGAGALVAMVIFDCVNYPLTHKIAALVIVCAFISAQIMNESHWKQLIQPVQRGMWISDTAVRIAFVLPFLSGVFWILCGISMVLPHEFEKLFVWTEWMGLFLMMAGFHFQSVHSMAIVAQHRDRRKHWVYHMV